MAKFKLTKREKSWILYDVGNSAFTMMVSTLIPIFFNAMAGNAGISSINYLAYWGYDYEVISGLSDKEYHKYLDLAAERNMTSGQIIDMGDYLLICIGRLNY